MWGALIGLLLMRSGKDSAWAINFPPAECANFPGRPAISIPTRAAWLPSLASHRHGVDRHGHFAVVGVNQPKRPDQTGRLQPDGSQRTPALTPRRGSVLRWSPSRSRGHSRKRSVSHCIAFRSVSPARRKVEILLGLI
jgi:hypothetical protein